MALSAVIPAVAAAEEVLYGDVDAYNGAFIASHDLAPAGGAAENLDRYDSRAADDFEVPVGTTWHVRQLAAGGRWSRHIVKVRDAYSVDYDTSDVTMFATEAPAKVRVTIHADAGGRPGNPLLTSSDGQTCWSVKAWGTYSIVTGKEPACRGSNGMLAKRFEPPLPLRSGRYWVTFQAVSDPRVHGEWFWDDASCSQLNLGNSCYAGAHWQDLGGGYGTGCTAKWRPISECLSSYRSPYCETRIAGTFPSPPVCQERRPNASSMYGRDLAMRVLGTAITSSER